MGRTIAVLMASALLCASCATTEEKTDGFSFESAALFGMVYDGDNQPCAGVRVSLDGVEGPITDIRGRFILPELPRGVHEVTARKVGYEDLSVSFAFLSRTDVLYLRMTSLAQLLAQAEQSLEARRWEEADAFLVRAERLDPADPVTMYLKAVRWYKLEKYAEAAGQLEAILTKGFKEPSVYLFLADLYERRLGDPARARSNLEAYLVIKWDADVEKRWKALQAVK
jgi:tetratricopeptide (TPR) repeat protein